ncbi:MAG TPA: hypothetical protein VFB43_10395 [Terracidiphilus sp.]|nr:hypothetical protein [Terracidiphilus sp.]
MTLDSLSAMRRREFLKLAGATTVFSLAHGAVAAPSGRVSIIVDAGSSAVSGNPVKRAAEKLKQALAAKSVNCEIVDPAERASGSAFCVVVASAASPLAKGFAAGSDLTTPDSLRMASGHVADAPAILVSGANERGFVYGLLELAERAQFGPDPLAALHIAETIEERPANPIRCVSRYFCSELEDKPWYYDKEFWPAYLDTLVASRFNRFCLAYGLEYDFPRGVTDDYLHLPYPYLFEVPGYSSVRVMQLRSADGKVLPQPVPLSNDERDRNFEMLKFIAAETGKRGLHFQLGIWTHAYEWTASPNAYHHIDGLTPETHAAYCRDALAIILKECPQIQGLTMRVHGESGIPEGSYPFWKTLFEAIAGAGRTIEIDMHAKGVNQTMIDIATATGMPVTLGAKYSAEHQSLGYEQADIRALEIPNPNHHDDAKLFSLSGGSRLFTRYGYGDFFQEGSRAKVLFRLWPGTQRHLLCADPEMAAAYGRTSHLCGALGLDLMEPLTFKGREGSGHAGGRCAYADASLNPKADWEKYEYYYRVWGRKLYDPDADLDTTRRYLKSNFGHGATAVETALANSSRILALITSAHLPSASNHAFWAELYTNQPIVLGSERSPYGDTPDPKVFGTVSPLDPQIFSTIVEHVQDLLAGRSNPKYSPIEMAQWIEDFTAASNEALAKARAKATSSSSAEFRRIEEDVLIQNGLGAFFAAKVRSGVLYEIYQQTGNADAGKLALEQYKKARTAWAKMADRASRVYVADVSYGDVPMRRGHWADRLEGIDADIAAMEQKLQSPPASSGSAQNAAQAVRAAEGKPSRPAVQCVHTPAESFHPGQALNVSLQISGSGATVPSSVSLYYRHVNQAERWRSVEMSSSGGNYSAAIPADYTQSPYPLQYYFALAHAADSAWLYPGLNPTLSNQPYYAIAQRS